MTGRPRSAEARGREAASRGAAARRRLASADTGVTTGSAPVVQRHRLTARPRRPRALVVMRLVLIALGVAPGLAWGHAVLVKSTPAQRASLAKSPDRVQLWFNEPLEAKFARVSVWDGQGRQIDQEDARVSPDDPKALSVGIPALRPGAYIVRYRVLSVDGHVVEGSFRFSVRGPR